MSPGKEHQKSIADFDLEPSLSVNYSTTAQCFSRPAIVPKALSSGTVIYTQGGFEVEIGN